MRRLFRWAFRVLVLCLVVVVGLLLSLDHLARELAERKLRAATGLEARLGRLNVGLLSPTLTFEKLRLYNRADFGGAPLVEIADGRLEYDPGELLAGRLRCRLLRLEIAELNLVVNRAGALNIPLAANSPPPGTPRPPRDIAGLRFRGIDTLNLSLGRVTAVKLNAPQVVREVNARLHNRVFTRLDSVEDLQFQLGVLLLEQNGGVGLVEYLGRP